jgi:hypothetical protein
MAYLANSFGSFVSSLLRVMLPFVEHEIHLFSIFIIWILFDLMVSFSCHFRAISNIGHFWQVEVVDSFS